MRSRNRRPTVYVHRGSGIAIGSDYPGIYTNVRSCHHVRPGGALRALTITLCLFSFVFTSRRARTEPFSSDSEYRTRTAFNASLRRTDQ